MAEDLKASVVHAQVGNAQRSRIWPTAHDTAACKAMAITAKTIRLANIRSVFARPFANSIKGRERLIKKRNRAVFHQHARKRCTLTHTTRQGRRPFGSWGTRTLIAGLTMDALVAPWVIKGAIDGPAFAAYVREVLMPEIEPGTAVILDNLATHRNKEAVEALRDHGCWLLYLPPHTPDLNPIEQAFTELKEISAGSVPPVHRVVVAIPCKICPICVLPFRGGSRTIKT